MTTPEIIAMAREAAARHGHTLKTEPSPETMEFIVEMFNMATAHEREACARLVESKALRSGYRPLVLAAQDFAQRMAADIRARGKA